jgi:hypothetical protein
MFAAARARKMRPMHESHRLFELRDEEARERHAIRRAERQMAREARQMQQELRELEDAEAQALPRGRNRTAA